VTLFSAIDILLWADWCGMIAFALSGVLVGIRNDLDIIGVFLVSMLTASGGGMLRDVMLGVTPDVLINPRVFYIVISVMALTIIFKLHRHSNLERRAWFVISDTVGLIAFSITGAFVGMEAGLHFFGVLIIAFITATGGGIIRDILVNSVPFLLKGGFHGTFALCVAAIMFSLEKWSLITDEIVIGVFLLAVIARLWVYPKQWYVPKIK